MQINGRIAISRDSPLYLAMSNGLAQIATAVIFILAARSNSPTVFGTLVATIGAANFSSVAVEWGGAQRALLSLATHSWDTDRWLTWLLWRQFWFTIAGTLTALLSLIVLDVLPALATGLYFSTLGLAFATSHPLRINYSFARLSVITLGWRILAIAFMLALTSVDLTTSAALPLSLAIAALGEASTMFHSGGVRTGKRVRGLNYANIWARSGAMGITSVAMLARQLETGLIAVLGGPVQSATYGAVARWHAPIQLVASAYSQAGFPRWAKQPSIALRDEVMTYRWLMLTGFSTGILLFVVAPSATSVLGDAYGGSASILRILIIGSLFGLFIEPALAIARARGRELLAGLIAATCVALQFAIAVAIGKDLTAQTMAYLYTLTQATMALVLISAYAFSRQSRSQQGDSR